MRLQFKKHTTSTPPRHLFLLTSFKNKDRLQTIHTPPQLLLHITFTDPLLLINGPGLPVEVQVGKSAKKVNFHQSTNHLTSYHIIVFHFNSSSSPSQLFHLLLLSTTSIPFKWCQTLTLKVLVKPNDFADFLDYISFVD